MSLTHSFFSLDIYSLITTSYPGWGKGLTLMHCPHPPNLLWLHFIQGSNLDLITVQYNYKFNFQSLPLPPQVCGHIINICSNLLYYFLSQICIKLSGWCYMYWCASSFMHLKHMLIEYFWTLLIIRNPKIWVINQNGQTVHRIVSL